MYLEDCFHGQLIMMSFMDILFIIESSHPNLITRSADNIPTIAPNRASNG
jgi:hypothetical protein